MKDYISYIAAFAAGALITGLCFIAFRKPPQTITKEKTVTKIEYRDTTINVVRHYTMPTVPKLVYLNDTIVKDNVVYIRDSTSTYTFNEEDYDLNIQAVKLTDYDLNIHIKEPVVVPTEITTTTIKNRQKSKVTFGVAFGMGATYDMFNKNMAFGPSVTGGIVLNF